MPTTQPFHAAFPIIKVFGLAEMTASAGVMLLVDVISAHIEVHSLSLSEAHWLESLCCFASLQILVIKAARKQIHASPLSDVHFSLKTSRTPQAAFNTILILLRCNANVKVHKISQVTTKRCSLLGNYD